MRPPANHLPPPKCPKCKGSFTKVVLTKRTADRLTVRRRKCTTCKYRFYTTQELAPPEIPIDGERVCWVNEKYEQEIYILKAVPPQVPTRHIKYKKLRDLHKTESPQDL